MRSTSLQQSENRLQRLSQKQAPVGALTTQEPEKGLQQPGDRPALEQLVAAPREREGGGRGREGGREGGRGRERGRERENRSLDKVRMLHLPMYMSCNMY